MWEPTRLSPLRHAINAVLFAAILALGFSVFSPGTSAAQNCGIHKDVVKLLGSRYAETPTALGLGANGAIIEVFSTKDGATWTMLSTRTNGKTCIVTSGEQWIPAIPANLPTQQPLS